MDCNPRVGVTWRTFWAHGALCAGHPWEVIFSVITATIAMISFADWYKDPALPRTPQEYQGLDVVVMTVLRCSALLYTYHQFRTLHRLGSKYILGVAGLVVVFSSFVFSCSVIKLLDSDVSDLKDALFFLLLLVDLSRTSMLAQFALASSSQTEVCSNIAHGMARIGPSLTLDTIVEALVIGAGTLSGVSRLEQMCAFACLSILVNYIVFMTFFPACLSLILELSNRCSSGSPPWQMKTLARAMVDQERPNPVVQRVKIIMSVGLLLVHGITRWSVSLSQHTITLTDAATSLNSSTDPHVIVRLLNAGLDHIVFMVILAALIVKYVLFESQGQLEESLIHDSLQDTHEGPSRQSNKGKGMQQSLMRQRQRCNTVTVGQRYKEVAVECEKLDQSCQTEEPVCEGVKETVVRNGDLPPRSLDECVAIMKSEAGAKALSDSEVVLLVEKKQLPGYQLEKVLGDPSRAVAVRRRVVAPHTAHNTALDNLPHHHYDYSKVVGVCCENVVGYMPVPVGVAGPLMINGQKYMVPLATTEGCLVASTNRGCRALVNGVRSEILRDGMTRAPSVRLPSATQAREVFMWLRKQENFAIIKEGFDSTSRFARLQDLHVGIAGRLLYMRFVAQTGDAMGMNMVSKGTEAGLKNLKKYFPDLEVLSMSGNYCVDKKPSAINWIEGRGKSVVCEAVVPGKVVTDVLKTTVSALVEANITKNLVGSSLAGSIGGNNAHAANIVAAMFIACGQDPAQVVGSSNCMTLMEKWGEHEEDLHITVTMPSLEVGTVGGGTSLHPQAACLTMLNVKGANLDNPGENACQFAKIVASTVLAGELSLMSALAAGHLVKSHMAHNRAKAAATQPSSASLPSIASTENITTTTTSSSSKTTQAVSDPPSFPLTTTSLSCPAIPALLPVAPTTSQVSGIRQPASLTSSPVEPSQPLSLPEHVNKKLGITHFSKAEHCSLGTINDVINKVTNGKEDTVEGSLEANVDKKLGIEDIHRAEHSTPKTVNAMNNNSKEQRNSKEDDLGTGVNKKQSTSHSHETRETDTCRTSSGRSLGTTVGAKQSCVERCRDTKTEDSEKCVCDKNSDTIDSTDGNVGVCKDQKVNSLTVHKDEGNADQSVYCTGSIKVSESDSVEGEQSKLDASDGRRGSELGNLEGEQSRAVVCEDSKESSRGSNENNAPNSCYIPSCQDPNNMALGLHT